MFQRVPQPLLSTIHLGHILLLMGNIFSASTSTKLVLSDGTFCSFDHPTTVAELMFEHPGEHVFQLHSLVSDGIKARPLPADHELNIKKVYVMLSAKGGKVPRMSSKEARSILKRSRSERFRKPRVGFDKEKAEENGGSFGFGEAAEMTVDRPEFLSRQLSSRRWRPSLDTIVEKKGERKVGHWFF